MRYTVCFTSGLWSYKHRFCILSDFSCHAGRISLLQDSYLINPSLFSSSSFSFFLYSLYFAYIFVGWGRSLHVCLINRECMRPSTFLIILMGVLLLRLKCDGAFRPQDCKHLQLLTVANFYYNFVCGLPFCCELCQNGFVLVYLLNSMR